MPWRLGIDEAGYGPNLGPFVMSAVACQVPEGLAQADLWRVLKKIVRRCEGGADRRLPVDDSKLVYGAAGGLGDLEFSVLSFLEHLHPFLGSAAGTRLDELLAWLAPRALEQLQREVWFTGASTLPLAASVDDILDRARCLHDALLATGIVLGPIESVLFCPARFNELVDATHTKGAVLGLAWTELVRGFLEPDPPETVHCVVDKHGGRNQYSALVQHAVGEYLVLAEIESMDLSQYVVCGRPWRFSFLPRADSGDFCVALASMISKYVREALMHEFNGFWQKEVPGLKSTAGYPGDSARFFADIAPARMRLNLADRVLWRQR